MMSTALVMAVESEQPKVRSATSDPVESGEMTFAQSFGEHVGLTADAQTMNSTGDASSEIQAKSSDAPSASLIGVKGNTGADQRMTKLSETKSLAMTAASGTGKSLLVETGLVTRANAADRGQSKTVPGQVPAGRVEVPQNVKAKTVALGGASQTKTTETTEATGTDALPVADAEHDEISSDISNDMLAAKPTAVDSVRHESAERSLLPRDAVEPVLSETVPVGKTLDATAAKKRARTQESAIEAKAASKADGTIESMKIVGSAPVVAGVQGAASAPIQVFAPGDAQLNVVGVTRSKDSGVIGKPTEKLVAGASTTGTDNTSRKAIARAGKDEIETTERAADPTASTAVATGFGVEVAKAAAVASTAGKDADEKTMAAVESATLVHPGGGSEVATSGIIPGAASGQILTEASGAKVQAGEAGAHSTSFQAGLGEQDSSGSASGEMGMSHRTLLATPTTLEIGLANSTQGWLKIRAEMTDGGGVNASLSSATSAGQEMLRRELPALTAYLQEERVAVNTIAVPATLAAGTESRFTGGMNGEGSGQTRQDSGQGGRGDGQGPIPTAADRVDEISTYMGLNGVGESGSLLDETYAGGGSWLNVRA